MFLVSLAMLSDHSPGTLCKAILGRRVSATVIQSKDECYVLSTVIRRKGQASKVVVIAKYDVPAEQIAILPRKKGFLLIANPVRVPCIWKISATGMVTHVNHVFATEESFKVYGKKVAFSVRRNWEVKEYQVLNIEDLSFHKVSRSDAKRQGLSFLDR